MNKNKKCIVGIFFMSKHSKNGNLTVKIRVLNIVFLPGLHHEATKIHACDHRSDAAGRRKSKMEKGESSCV